MQRVHGAEELAGVGLFFQQSPQHGVFVASVTPGCAGARTGCINKGDVVIQVHQESVAGFSLAQLRQLVLGPPGSFCVLTFRRQTSSNISFCYDLDLMRGTGEFLDLVSRNAQQAQLKEELEMQLTRHHTSTTAIESDIQALVTHPTIKVEDGRTRELAHELRCRMDDLSRLQATQIRVEERCRDLEKRKVEAQERVQRERSERLKGETMERDHKEQILDLQRGHAEEAALAASVLDKLQNDVKMEDEHRQQAEQALSESMAHFHDMKAQMLDLRLRQQRLRRILSNGHDNMEKALRLNQNVFSDLSAVLPSMHTSQDAFLNALLAAVRT
jgi:flagellar biosynthesis GTPase FlhF